MPLRAISQSDTVMGHLTTVRTAPKRTLQTKRLYEAAYRFFLPSKHIVGKKTNPIHWLHTGYLHLEWKMHRESYPLLTNMTSRNPRNAG